MKNDPWQNLFDAVFAPQDPSPEYHSLVASLAKFKKDWQDNCEEVEREFWVEGYLTMLSDVLDEEFGLDTEIVDIRPYATQV